MATLSENRKARFDYEVLDTIEAGMELRGFEVKAIRNGRMNLSGSYAIVRKSEIWLIGSDIPPYQAGNTPKEYDPGRSRKLLLHKGEIESLIGKTKEKGLTLVPLRVYSKHRKIKLELGLARHKKKADKREVIKKREADREINKALKRG